MFDSPGEELHATLPRRPYGRDGVSLSIIGFGGIVVAKCEPQRACRIVAKAIERGVNYFEVAPTYDNAEERLGPALEPYRQQCFLACKTACRDAAGAAAELAQSLQRLRTDYFDLYQLHALASVEKDVEPAFAKGGAMDVLLAAKKSGQVRYLGFSAHSQEAAFEALDRYPFDSVLFPINFAMFLNGGFGAGLLQRAQREQVTVLAIKALARQRWAAGDAKRQRFDKCWYEPLSERQEAELALRFTLSQNVTTAVSPGEEELLWLAIDIARDFHPLDEAELLRLSQMAQQATPLFG